MSNTLTPEQRAIRSLDNARLAAMLDGPHKVPALPHPDGPHLNPIRVSMKQVRQEAARRLRWDDVYEAHKPEAMR